LIRQLYSRFSGLKISSKIMILAAIMLIFMFSNGIRATTTMGKLNQETEIIYHDRLEPIKILADIRQMAALNAIDMAEHLIATSPAEMQRLEENIRMRAEAANQGISAYKKTKMTEAESQMMMQLEGYLAKYRPLRSEMLRLSRDNLKDEAKAAYALTVVYRDKTFGSIEDLIALKQELSAKTMAAAREDYAQAKTEFAFFLVIAIIASIIIVFFISRMITRPLKALDHAARQVADGHLGIEWDISGKGKDEIGSLSVSFGKMLQSLRYVVHQIHGITSSVAASAEELTASSEQAAEISTHMAHGTQEVARGSVRQNDMVQEALAAIEQSSAATEQIAAAAQMVAASAKEVNSKAGEGSKAMSRTKTEMEQIAVSTGKMTAVVKDLASNSQAIGQIADMIGDIADQTNLLALNAAIEAARAGDHGSGFAVVAEEVRKLAEQSKEATKKITLLIRQIQTGTDSVVLSAKENSRLVEGGSIVIANGTQAFQDIREGIEGIAEQIAEVSRSVMELAKGNEGMLVSVSAIGDAAKKASAACQEMASGAEEQAASAQEIAASAEALAKLGQEMQNVVGQFRE